MAPKKTYTAVQVLRAFRALEKRGGRAPSAGTVAKEVGCSRAWAYMMLRDLIARGEIRQGANGRFHSVKAS